MAIQTVWAAERGSAGSSTPGVSSSVKCHQVSVPGATKNLPSTSGATSCIWSTTLPNNCLHRPITISNMFFWEKAHLFRLLWLRLDAQAWFWKKKINVLSLGFVFMHLRPLRTIPDPVHNAYKCRDFMLPWSLQKLCPQNCQKDYFSHETKFAA